MKKLLLVFVAGVILLAAATDSFAGRHRYGRTITVHSDDWYRWDEDVSFDLDDGTIVIIYDRDDRYRDREVVEFTEDYELFIDGDKIDLDEDQQALVAEFYDQGIAIVDYAKEIGWEGAKIGVEGAKLGISAIGCLFKLLSPHYDTDDYEDEMERKAEDIEYRAEILEEKAEAIEDMAEDLEYIVDDLRDQIPELDRLGWF
jgi:hypothetical protein